MESNIIKKLRIDNNGGVATYVMLLFGMTFILYLFGFHTIWDTYSSYTVYTYNGTIYNIDNIAVNFGVGILTFLADFFTNPDNYTLLGLGILGFLGMILAGYLLRGSLTTILQYLIPIILLGALNIFIFPLSSLNDTIHFLDSTGTTVTIFLFAFFNLVYILAVIEFIRGNV